MRRPSTIITAAAGGVVAGALLVGGGAAVGAAVYDAQNAHKVDGRHAVGAGATADARKGKLVAADATGKLPAGAIPRQVVFNSKYGTSFVTTTSSTPATVTGASASVTMPKAGRLVVTFSAESVCSGSTGSGWCGVDVLVDGNPAPGENDDAFDSDDDATESSASWESHSVTRVIPVAKGTHTVVVKSYSANGGATFDLDDWTLTVLGIL